MDFEKYTDKSKQIIQAAQTLALRRSHQHFQPEHVLAGLMEDREHLSEKLIRACGGNPELVADGVEEVLSAIPKVEGADANQLYTTPEVARFFDMAVQLSAKASDEFVTVERLLQGLAMSKGTNAAAILSDAGITPQKL